jgi:AraC-like DNA-binding protein
MTAVSAPRPGWELLAGQVNQRRHEALRAYLYEGASLQQAADATGYTRASGVPGP